MTILVTGATGNVGSAVVAALRRRGATVRAFVRQPTGTLGDDVELALGDFDDRSSIRAALDGVDRVFLSSADSPAKVEHEAAVIDAAAGVELTVKASTIAAQIGSPLPPLDWNSRSETTYGDLAFRPSWLRSSFYMTNLLAVAEPVCAQHVLPAPAGDARIAMIDPFDVGAVAAVILTGSGNGGRTYELTGPDAVGYRDVAAALSRVTGIHIEYIDVPPDAAREGLVASGMPGWLVQHLDGAFAKFRAGEFAATTDTVAVVTGRPPRSIADFITEYTEAFTPIVQPA